LERACHQLIVCSLQDGPQAKRGKKGRAAAAAPAAKAPSKADKRRAASDAPAVATACEDDSPSDGPPSNKRQKAATTEAPRRADSPAYTSPACEAEARFAAALLHERAEFAKQARRCRPARRLRALHRPAS
jgi:hypothetical protein